MLRKIFQCCLFAEPRRFKFDPSQIESVDQMLLGARIAQNSLSPVAEESIDGGEQQPLYSEKQGKTLERYHLLQLDFNTTNKIYLPPFSRQSVEIFLTSLLLH